MSFLIIGFMICCLSKNLMAQDCIETFKDKKTPTKVEQEAGLKNTLSGFMNSEDKYVVVLGEMSKELKTLLEDLGKEIIEISSSLNFDEDFVSAQTFAFSVEDQVGPDSICIMLDLDDLTSKESRFKKFIEEMRNRKDNYSSIKVIAFTDNNISSVPELDSWLLPKNISVVPRDKDNALKLSPSNELKNQ